MNPKIIFDDIGSYPLPEGISRDWIERAVTSRDEDEHLFGIISDTMEQKIAAGVEVPNYPQIQDMNLSLIHI